MLIILVLMIIFIVKSILDYGDNYYIVYDKETKVMYTKSNSSSNCGDFTLLVNADGTPKLWESEVQR